MNSEVLSYRPRIDGLRFLAITFVLIEHLGGSLAGHVAGGYYGVDLFFVISGYLITGILLRDSGHSWGQSYRAFVGRRVLRIFPVYYALLAVLFALNYPMARQLIGPLASYTFNYAAADIQAAHHKNELFYLWSLSVEEQFYLFWPIIAISLRRKKPLLLFITAAIVLFGYAQIKFSIVPSLSMYNYSGTLNRMGSLGLGALGATWVSWRPFTKSPFDNSLVEWVVLAVLVSALTVDYSWRYVLMGPCSLFLVLKSANGSFRTAWLDKLLTHRWVIYVGSISYGIYLFHVPLANLISEYAFDHFWHAIPFASFGALSRLQWHSWILKFPLYSGAAIALAGLSFKYFESPILRYKDRWFRYEPARTPSHVEPAAPSPRIEPLTDRA